MSILHPRARATKRKVMHIPASRRQRTLGVAAVLLPLVVAVMAEPTSADDLVTFKAPYRGGWTHVDSWCQQYDSCSWSGKADASTGRLGMDLALDSGADGTLPNAAVPNPMAASSRLWAVHRLPAGATSANYQLKIEVGPTLFRTNDPFGSGQAKGSLFAFAQECTSTLSSQFSRWYDHEGDKIRWESGVMKRVPLNASSSATVQIIELSLPIASDCGNVGIGLLGWAYTAIPGVVSGSTPSLGVPERCLPNYYCTPSTPYVGTGATVYQGYARTSFHATLRRVQAHAVAP